MATIKHIASKNADYGAAEKYLMYEHDAFSMKPVLDKNGYLIPREDYRIGAVLTTPEKFAADCMAANFRYGKNMAKGDIKSHHYIISFDPRDGPDHGLDMDRAQELGMDFCRKHFPGHQALVCTHPDGHNHSGNIHVHIVINSLRILDVPYVSYMDRASDTKAGMKHRCTGKLMHYLRSEVMEMCQEEGLYQIDLLGGSKERMTEREYWAKQKGQQKLDQRNQEIRAAGLKPVRTKFETDKEILRRQIRKVLETATDYEMFQSILLNQYGISVKESRGRFSYLTQERTKPITARKLGDAFDKTDVLSKLEENQKALLTEKSNQPQFPESKENKNRHSQPSHQKALSGNDIQHMVDAEEKMAVSRGYGNWAKLHNLKNAAKSFAYLQNMGFSTPEELDVAYGQAKTEAAVAKAAYIREKDLYQKKKELLTHVTGYRMTKKQREGYKRSMNKKAYRSSWKEELDKSNAAIRYFSSHDIRTVPARKTVQEEVDAIASRKNELYQLYEEKKHQRDELEKVRGNLYQMFSEGRETPPPKPSSIRERLHEKQKLVAEREEIKKARQKQRRQRGDMEL